VYLFGNETKATSPEPSFPGQAMEKLTSIRKIIKQVKIFEKNIVHL